MESNLEKYDEILSLWKDREEEWLRFHEIKRRMEEKGWYERKIVRYVKKMVEILLLEKRKEGIKGARAYYRTTNLAHEYEANSFFERVRRTCQRESWIIKGKDSFLVYGIPPRNELSSLEDEILEQILKRIYEAFFDLHLLKQSIIARKKVDQPIDYQLIEYYLYEEIADLFKQQLKIELIGVKSENEIGDLIDFAKRRGIDIVKPDRFLEIEKKWKSPNIQIPLYNRRYALGRSFEEACLAVLVMLSPDEIAEYALDSYNYLKNHIEELEEWKLITIPLSDRSLVILARDFLRRESFRGDPNIRDRILALRNWSWLRLKFGSETTEKLVKIIYYLWQKNMERIEAIKKVEKKLEPVKPRIHVITEEEANREIQKVIAESSKIKF